jgi:hypothetical protein
VFFVPGKYRKNILNPPEDQQIGDELLSRSSIAWRMAVITGWGWWGIEG